jgi:folate-binding protein YgfZ
VYIEPSRERDLIAALIQAGAHEVSHEAIEAVRIEAELSRVRVDMTDDTIPLEAGIEERALSMSKGCYVGQEVIIRVLHRGHGRVARKLVTLRIDGAVPQRGARLFAADRDVWFCDERGGLAATWRDRDGLRASRLPHARDDARCSGLTPAVCLATVTERVILSGADQLLICRRKAERREIGARYPSHLLTKQRPGRSAQRASIEVQGHCTVLVRVRDFETSSPNVHIGVELFANLADQRRRVRLALVYFASGKLP